MVRKSLSVAALIALPLGVVGAAGAQGTAGSQGTGGGQSGVEVETVAPPPPKFEIIRPEAKGSEITRPRDADIYIGNPVINYDPAFIEPFSKQTATGRMGMAGWGSPVGVVTTDGPAAMRQPGWLSFGFAITWGGPERKPGVTPAATSR
ncbi:MAG TPA: hypothetical protein VEL75_05930 [Candidatus Methylomirabilis sp.]|nr:hypothetical protein [Candidatus Methylomirabilis sp.]